MNTNCPDCDSVKITEVFLTDTNETPIFYSFDCEDCGHSELAENTESFMAQYA